MSRLTSSVFGGLLCLMSFNSLVFPKVKSADSKQSQIIEATIETDKKTDQYYKTKTGKCYHKENCSCLSKSKIKVSEKGIKEEELKPCKKCFKK